MNTGIGPGQQVELTEQDWTPASECDTYRVHVNLDYSTKVSESNENDNQADYFFEVTA